MITRESSCLFEDRNPGDEQVPKRVGVSSLHRRDVIKGVLRMFNPDNAGVAHWVDLHATTYMGSALRPA